MAGNNRMTGQQAPTSCVKHTFTASTAVSVGDLMFRSASTGRVLPMSGFTWTSDLSTTQLAASKYFAGISNERRLATETDTPEGVVMDSGEAMFPCSALGQAYPTGTLIGFAENSSALSNTNVAIVTDRARAIGCLSRPAASGATQVYARYQAPITQPNAFVNIAGESFTGLKILAADGADASSSAKDITLTGAAVGDRVVIANGQVKASSNAHTFVPTATDFESVISKADNIVQNKGSNLSANTYFFVLLPPAV